MENPIWDLLVEYCRRTLYVCIITHKDFSCFNAFSRVDVRVEVKIPGGVESYFVDVRGERFVLPTGSLYIAQTISQLATC